MRKAAGSVYDKWTISVVICDTDMTHERQVMAKAYIAFGKVS